MTTEFLLIFPLFEEKIALFGIGVKATLYGSPSASLDTQTDRRCHNLGKS